MRATSGLRDGEVHVWLARTGTADACLMTVLSPAERDRAAAFRFARHRQEYVVAHALLRLVLAPYVAADPAALVFAHDPQGRPWLRGCPDWLDFNLSHTTGLAAVAVARAPAVGVDVEYLAEPRDDTALADRHFAATEVRALRTLAPVPRSERFHELWTLKEAFAKARGDGLALPLDSVTFALGPGRAPRATFGPRLADEVDRWRFALRRPTPRHVLAVARRGREALRLRVGELGE